MPVLHTGDGIEYDKSRIVLYAYRHTYAQRHADAGVPVDVLRELMDHRKLDTTSGYYRVGETRRREAVDRVAAMQFDRHGNRIWRQAQALLDSQHARRAVGEVAVPFGVCAEPSNVKAGGSACPYRFRCAGCDHFRTDVSYLPDLHAYLDDLLRNRERLLATTDIDEWARAEAMPSAEEITPDPPADRPHHHGLDELTPNERNQINRPSPRCAATAAPCSACPAPARPARPTPGEHHMTTNTAVVDTMTAGRRADSARRRQRVLNALDTPARRRGNQRHRHRPPRRRRPHVPLPAPRPARRIHAAEAEPPDTPGAGRPVTRASLQADLLAAQERSARSPQASANWRNACPTTRRTSLARIRTRRPRRHRPAPAKITNLEQQAVDSRLQLEERDQDLAAARAANRELMTRLNYPSRPMTHPPTLAPHLLRR